jgi:hypothetical protein
MKERELYPRVANWAKRELGCFATGIDKGVRHGRIDVVGLRDTGGRLSGHSEVVAIEVKRGTQPFANAIGQATGYSIYADRCYLADVRPSGFSDVEKSIALRLGVGLIEIRGSSHISVREVLTAPVREPLGGLRLDVIEKLNYSLCTLCGSLFERGDAGNWSAHVTREQPTKKRHMRDAVESEKGLVYWLTEPAERSVLPQDESETSFHRRYVCADCMEALFSFLARPEEDT